MYKFSTDEKKVKLVEVVEETSKLSEKANGLSLSVEENVKLLKRILNENIEEKDGQVQKRKDKVKDRIISPMMKIHGMVPNQTKKIYRI